MTTLRKGSKGPEVEKMQTALNRAGATLELDGSYGGDTEQAVKNFQKASGIKVDGVCGPVTWEALGPYLQDFSAVTKAVKKCLDAIEALPEFKQLEALLNG